MIVNCPSGFTVELRKLGVREANILSDQQLQKKGMALDSLLSSIWVSTVDNGPYNFAGAPVWENVLAGDRFYAQLVARAATFGDYEFHVPCQHCREKIDWTLDLNELPVRQLAAADREAFQAGNKFTEVGPDGKTYRFHLSTGKHERLAGQMLKTKQSSRVTASLLSRIDEIVDEEGKEVLDRESYLTDLDLDLGMALLDMLDAHDCGVDTSIVIECNHCMAENEMEVPFGQAGYWSPRKAKKTRK